MEELGIKKMTTVERIQAMEALWDSLLNDDSDLQSPHWHQDILEGRKRQIESGKANFISIEKLKASRKS
ncbi:MAG: addiction module protein [Proteobacteria bacterium]|nr:addiction module protein [Pseudomonadota bacterium]